VAVGGGGGGAPFVFFSSFGWGGGGGTIYDVALQRLYVHRRVRWMT